MAVCKICNCYLGKMFTPDKFIYEFEYKENEFIKNTAILVKADLYWRAN